MTHAAPAPPPAPAAPATPSRSRWFGYAGLIGGLVAVTLIAAGVSACATANPTPSPTIPPSPVDGVVVSVDAASLGEVRGFSLRTTNGVVYTLKLGTLQNATSFSPSHLAEHQATSSPIRAWYLLDDGTPVVYRLEDAVP